MTQHSTIMSQSIVGRLVLAMSGVILLIVMVLVWHGHSLKEAMLEQAGLSAARAALGSAANARQFYAREIVPKAKTKGMNIHQEFKGKEDAIPLPASLIGALAEADKSGNGLRLYSKMPFSFRKAEEVRRDPFEDEALTWLESNPKGEFFRIERRDGQPVMRLAKADIMVSDGCTNCHNNHPDSPKRDWKVGDVRGALTVSIPIGVVEMQIAKHFQVGGIILAICFGLGAVLLFLVVRSVKRSLKTVVDAAEQVVMHNDFTCSVPTTGASETVSVAVAINKLMESLRSIVNRLRDSVTLITTAASELTGLAGEVSHASDKQSEAVESAAAAIEEISVSLSHTADNAAQARSIAESSHAAMNKTIEVTHAAMSEMEGIAGAIRDSKNEVQELAKRSEAINGIVGVIREIADQTNLLALNAAIEAARAGETGRGFAVVADEVRKLAERTSQSTQEIAKLVHGTQEQVDRAVATLAVADERSLRSVQLTRQSEESLRGVVRGAEDSVAHMRTIADALHEQDAAVRDIAVNVERIARMTEGNSAAASKNRHVAEEMERLSSDLNTMTLQFKT
ncbi:MAG: methyl-accepting chemotaxis protein [Rhodocyclaceae bacterium]|nr:methyl-accepting chemotaxis protein [Rhodocyclaceae bacterium]